MDTSIQKQLARICATRVGGMLMSSIRFPRRTLLQKTAVGTGALLGLAGITSKHVMALRQSEPTRISLLLNWNPNAEHAPYYLGQERGFYKEEGIEAEILP